MGKARKNKKKKMKPVSDKDMLATLATIDEVTAVVPTDREQIQGIYPNWAELILEIKRFDDGSLTPAFPLNARMPLRRHDGELIIEVLDDVLHPNRGGGSADRMWDELDAVIDRIMKKLNKEKNPHDHDLGEAVGLTKALAIAVLPHEPFIAAQDYIKEVAMERFAIRSRAAG